MIWSKQKKILKSRLCDSLKGRVDFHTMKYRKIAHGLLGRAVVTLDKQEILSLVSLTYEEKHWKIYYPLYKDYMKEKKSRDEEQEKCIKAKIKKEFEASLKASEVATKILNEQGYFSERQFYHAVNMCLNMSIEDAIKSENILVRALSMFDRRLGKRRLIKMYDSIENEHDLVKKFYEIRINSEKILKNKNYIRQ